MSIRILSVLALVLNSAYATCVNTTVPSTCSALYPVIPCDTIQTCPQPDPSQRDATCTGISDSYNAAFTCTYEAQNPCTLGAASGWCQVRGQAHSGTSGCAPDNLDCTVTGLTNGAAEYADDFRDKCTKQEQDACQAAFSGGVSCDLPTVEEFVKCNGACGTNDFTLAKLTGMCEGLFNYLAFVGIPGCDATAEEYAIFCHTAAFGEPPRPVDPPSSTSSAAASATGSPSPVETTASNNTTDGSGDNGSTSSTNPGLLGIGFAAIVTFFLG